MSDLTETQRRTLRRLTDGSWHLSSRSGLVLGTVCAALLRQGLVERDGTSRLADPRSVGYRYRITAAGRAAAIDAVDYPALIAGLRAAMSPLVEFRDQHLDVESVDTSNATLYDAAGRLDAAFCCLDSALRTLAEPGVEQ